MDDLDNTSTRIAALIAETERRPDSTYLEQLGEIFRERAQLEAQAPLPVEPVEPVEPIELLVAAFFELLVAALFELLAAVLFQLLQLLQLAFFELAPLPSNDDKYHVKPTKLTQKLFVCLARNFGKGFVCRDLRDPPPPPSTYVVMVNSRNAAFAEERAEVEVLFAEAKKFQELGKKMKASMRRLETSGQILQEAMGPVYSNTQPLHVINDNVNKVLAVIETWQKPLEGRSKEENIIREGPSRVGVPTYIASLERVENMLSKLESKPLRVNQQAVDELGHLVRHGNGSLEDLYESTLLENAQKIEPLHFITKQIPFPTLPQNKLSDLASINSFLLSNPSRNTKNPQETNPAFRVYVDIRGSYLSTSLQNLASASVSMSRKKSPGETYRQGTSGISTYASGIEGMLIAEWKNLTAIFAREEWGTVFEMTTHQTLMELANTLREMNTQIRSSITTDCFLAFEVVDIVNRLASRIDHETGQLKQQLIDALRPIRDTAKLSLPELLDDVRRRIGNMIALPVDGAALPITTEVVVHLQTLVSYPQSLASTLISLGDGNWSSPSAATNISSSSLPSTTSYENGVNGNQLIAHYVHDSLDNLLSALEARARIIMKSKALVGIFMANNVAVADRMVRSSDLQPLLLSMNSPFKAEAWRKKGTGAYLDSWREPCAALMDVQYTNRGARPPSGNTGAIDSAAVIKGLGSKDKDGIKEKFKTFNSKFEELCARHREMTPAMERDVRNQLAREIQTLIEPLYARFWDRYHEIDKGKGKYVKYDKGSLATQLANLG